VLLNQMTDEERAAFQADYNRQGPAGRPHRREHNFSAGETPANCGSSYIRPMRAMADKHVVRFEPSGSRSRSMRTKICGRSRAGVMLMHGCKEGQCASCKSFILDGDDVDTTLFDIRVT